MRSLLFALVSASLSLTATAAPVAGSIAPTVERCGELALPFAVPPDEVTAEWCDADYSAWLDDRAASYCARHEGSMWCACYVAGFFDL